MAVFHDLKPPLARPAAPKPIGTICQPILVQPARDHRLQRYGQPCRQHRGQPSRQRRQGGRGHQPAHHCTGQRIGPGRLCRTQRCLFGQGHGQARQQADGRGHIVPGQKADVGFGP